MTTEQLPEQRDKELWKIAKKRAGFKSHLTTYIIVNIFLWAVWYFTGAEMNRNDHFPWPLWSTLGWGVGIAFHYASTYIYPKHDVVQREYDKLKSKQQQ